MLTMPKVIVINTGPIIALTAGLKNLKILKEMYNKVIVPYEVTQEILVKGTNRFDAKIFSRNKWLDKRKNSVVPAPFLKNALDKGEAAVIQTAINENIDTVCIDEAAGRRIARLNDLKLTGSLGIIISAIKRGKKNNIKQVIHNMKKNGVWISQNLENKAIELTNQL